jgi:predicted RNase H-like HicB family nuclease
MMAKLIKGDVEATVSIRKPYRVVFTREDVGGYSVSVDGLPGCFSQGDTMAEAKRNIREAIEGYLEAREILLRRGATKAGKATKGSKAAKAKPPKVKSPS